MSKTPKKLRERYEVYAAYLRKDTDAKMIKWVDRQIKKRTTCKGKRALFLHQLITEAMEREGREAL